MPSLFDPYWLGSLRLRNRIVMAPMTRSRAVTLAPDDDTVLYYRQRAGAGLIITEGAPISVEGRGQAYTPGIYSPDQIAGWSRVTEAVHAQGGAIYVQLWHVGRQSHTSHQSQGGAPVSSTAVRSHKQVYAFEDGAAKPMRVSMPRALRTEEVPRVTADFAAAARHAIVAGFDGVELHGANGYIFEQFINGALNDRTDRYGGSIENRLRFTLDTVDAVAEAIGQGRTGIRLAPFGRFGDMDGFADEEDTWLALASELSGRRIAYVHLSDQETLGAQAIPAGFVDKYRAAHDGTLIVAGGYDQDKGQRALDSGRADLIAVGRLFISNPDLVARWRNDWPVASFDRSTFYTQGRKGYTDYPSYTRPEE